MSTFLRLGISLGAAAVIIVIMNWPQGQNSQKGAPYNPAVTAAAEKLQGNTDNVALRIRYLDTLLQAYREVPDSVYLQLAEDTIQEGNVLHPTEVEYDFFAAKIALTRHHFEKALMLATRSMQARPSTSRYYGAAADAYIELGRYDEALATLQSMVDLRPDFSSFSRIAYMRELYGDLPGAMTALDSAIEAGSPLPENHAWALVQKANILAAAEPEQALSLYAEALNRQPEYAPALLGEAKIAFAQGDYAQTEQKLLAAFAAQPLPDFSAAITDFYIEQKNNAAANRYTQITLLAFNAARTTGNDVDMEEADFLLGIDEDSTRALLLAEAAYQKRPSAIAANVLAKAYLESNNLVQAKKYNTESRKLTEGTSSFLSSADIAITTGDILTAEGNEEGAKRWYETSLRMDPAFSFTDAARIKSILASPRPQ